VLTELVLQPASDVDQEELDQLTSQLRRCLLDEVDVDTVNAGATIQAAPDGAKSQYASIFGTLALGLTPVTLHSLIRVVQAWLKNRPVRTVKVTIEGDSIEVSHMSSSDQRRLIDSFIERHTAE
jgi:hypothetical protein